MKKYIAAAIGFCVGIGIAFWLFALAFTRSREAFQMAAMIPIAAGLAVSFCLALIDAAHGLLISGSVALPTVLMSLLLFAGVLREQRPDWGWVVLALAVVFCCLIGGRLAASIQSRKKHLTN